ncbi:MAG: hypothetical protein AB7T14_00940 [Candidatus Methylacidiphilaceae bacterium]
MSKWVKILEAAQTGMGWTDEALAERSRASLHALKELKAGVLDSGTLRSVASALRLGADALLSLAREVDDGPVFSAPATLRGIETGSQRGYLFWDSISRLAALIDIGNENRQVIELLEEEFLVPRYLFFTESKEPLDPAWLRFLEGRSDQPILPLHGNDGAVFSLGTLQVESRMAAGCEGVSRSLYQVRGLDVPIAFIGRSLLPPPLAVDRPSPSLYEAWLEEVRRHIFTLSDETILCPSSGSLTTVGFEKAHNPFFPEFEHFSSFEDLTEESRNP